MVIATCVSVRFPRFWAIELIGGREVKLVPEPYEIANGVVSALGYSFIVCSFVLLPLAWVSVQYPCISERVHD